MTPKLRFAPSPTGLLHIGNARMAVVNWLYARKHGGEMVLRLDDTDQQRSTEEYANAIQVDLKWLGLEWDSLERQASRMTAYDTAFDKLKTDGRLYACYETPEELEYKRKRQMRAGKPPVYDRAGLSLTGEQIASYEAEGRSPHWRFKLEHTDIAFEDLVRGPVHFHGENLSDPVLVRADGTYLYMMPSAVDDIDMGITHVIRGEDHVSNSAIQIQLFEALSAKVPAFAHLPLMTDAGGAGLSKRLGSLSLRDMREQGAEAMAVNSLLAHLGTSDDIEPYPDLGSLLDTFDISHFSRATPKFDPERLWALNAQLLHALPFDAVANRLEAMGLKSADARFWGAVRANLEKLSDCTVWHDVCYTPTSPVIADSDADFLLEATELLPDTPWDEDTWGTWTGAVKEETGRKGKSLFMPLRQALTGLDHGPELKNLLPIIGRERTLARLTGKTA